MKITNAIHGLRHLLAIVVIVPNYLRFPIRIAKVDRQILKFNPFFSLIHCSSTPKPPSFSGQPLPCGFLALLVSSRFRGEVKVLNDQLQTYDYITFKNA